MAKTRTRYVCQECGAASVKWQGRCPDCGRWNSLVEEVEKTASPRRASMSPAGGGQAVRPMRLRDVETREETRVRTGLHEFDRVSGGGLVRGSLLLVGGPPGIGKSTLLLQVAEAVGRQGMDVLYVTGEESPAQVRMRAERLAVETERLLLLPEIDLEQVLAHARETRPGLLMVDSIQTVFHPDVESAPGSVSQVRECTAALMRMAKSDGITVMLVGHVTKDGSIAGPRVMEHLVDTVLYFEGDGFQNHRMLRAVKNRFGSTSELGIFEMQGRGLVEVADASRFFLAQHVAASGSCIVPTMEGTRAICVEVQALNREVKGEGGPLTRRASGIDQNRLVMLLAVLSKRGAIAQVSRNDVFVNVPGGMEVDEPAVDLGVLVAVASTIRNCVLPEGLAVMGEVGLAGEVRGIPHAQVRVNECARLGFRQVIVPATHLKGHGRLVAPEGVHLEGVAILREALDRILGAARRLDGEEGSPFDPAED